MEIFIKSIQRKYKKKLISEEECRWPPIEGEKLINLQLVETDKAEGYHGESFLAHTKSKSNRDDSDIKVKIKRSPISQGKLFKTEKKKPVRKLLIEGNAGMGKTTLCTMLAEGWADGKILTQFDCVILLPLRKKSVSTATNLPELIKLLHIDSDICQLVSKELTKKDGEGFLFIADGWDELDSATRKEGSFLYDLLIGDALQESAILLTSRPSASASIRSHASVDRLVEVVGFNEENIEQYIKSNFGNCPESGSALIEQLENNPVIQNVCSVPLNCAIVCHLWSRHNDLPTTLTKLYSRMIRNVILRNIRKKFPELCPSALHNFDSIPDQLKTTFWLTCKFAYECLAMNQIVFSEDDLKKTFPEVVKSDANFMCFGLLQSAHSIIDCGHDLSFHFLHLTFQEYLAALYVATLPNNEKRILCTTLGEKDQKDRFAMVWRFLFGLCSRSEKNLYSKRVVCFDDNMIHDFIVPLVEEDRDSDNSLTIKCKDSNDTLFLCYCALESENKDVSSFFALMLDGQFKDSYDNLYDYAAVLNILRHTLSCNEVVIDLRGCGIGDKQLIFLTDILSKAGEMLKVQTLNLDRNKVTDQGANDLFCRASASLSGLTELSLEQNKICNIMFSFTDIHCKTLTDLTLADNFLGATGIQSLQFAIDTGYLQAITHLDVCNTFPADTDINGALLTTLLFSIASNCPKMRRLTLSKNNLGVPGAAALAEALPILTSSDEHKSLSLNLNEVNFDCEAMTVFSRSLVSSHTIVFGDQSAVYSCTLDLDDNQLGTCGLIELFQICRSKSSRVTDLRLKNVSSQTTASNKCCHSDHDSSQLIKKRIFGQRSGQRWSLPHSLLTRNNFCNKYLTTLNLDNNSDSSGKFILTLNSVIQADLLVNLKRLDLSNTFTPDAAANGELLASLLLSIALFCHQVSDLGFSQNNFNLPGASAVGKAFLGLIRNGHLSSIDLAKTCLSSEAIREFSINILQSASGFRMDTIECTELTIYLSDNPLGLTGLCEVFKILQGNIYPIQTLDLDNVITAADTKVEYEQLNQQPSTISKVNFDFQNETLTDLSLRDNDLSGNAVLVLTTVFQNCLSLTHLKCIRCCLTSTDISNILRKLKKSHKKLKNWDLYENLLEDKGVNELTEQIPTLFPCLEEVDIDENDLVSEGVKANLKKCLKVRQ